MLPAIPAWVSTASGPEVIFGACRGFDYDDFGGLTAVHPHAKTLSNCRRGATSAYPPVLTLSGQHRCPPLLQAVGNRALQAGTRIGATFGDRCTHSWRQDAGADSACASVGFALPPRDQGPGIFNGVRKKHVACSITVSWTGKIPRHHENLVFYLANDSPR